MKTVRVLWLLGMMAACKGINPPQADQDAGEGVDLGIVSDSASSDERRVDAATGLEDARDAGSPIDVPMDVGGPVDATDVGASADPDRAEPVDTALEDVATADAVDVPADVAATDVAGAPADVSTVSGDAAPDVPSTPDSGPALRGLTVMLDGTGTGTVTSTPAVIACPGTCDGSFADGSTVTLRAQVNTTNDFVGWTGCDTTTAGGTCIVTLTAPRVVIATFNHRDACAAGHGNIAGYDCVPPAPSGWTGPLAFWDAAGTAPHSCVEPFPTQQYTGRSNLTASPATCSTCTCGSPSGGTCNEEVYGQSSCTGGSVGLATGNVTNGCGNWTGSGHPGDRYTSFRFAGVYGVSCPAGPQVPTVPPSAYGRTGTACRAASPAPTAGCLGGNVCSPVPSSGDPSAFHLCLYQAGDMICPSGYSNRYVTYSGVSDTRSCSACSCYNPGGTCTGTLRFYADGSCGGELGSTAIDGVVGALHCLGFSSNFQSVRADWSGPRGTSCVPSVSRPTGAATPTGPTTFCCR